MRHIGGQDDPDAPARWADYAAQAWRRNGETADLRAVARQIGAIFKSGDRSAALRRIQAPTLVVHGDVDRMVHPSGGAATAAAIAGARRVTLDGMRHEIDARQSERLLPLLREHFARGQEVRQ
jgi:pimeloyl-ACP methyl ester carboxylesterase